MRVALLLTTALFVFSGCATPIRSTVDGYGEAPLDMQAPLYFDREAVPLAEKPIVDACREAAQALKLNVSDKLCPSCKRVEVRSRLAGTSQAVTSTGPAFGTSIGILGGGTGFGLGVGSGNTTSHPESERVIEIGIFEGKSKNLLRTISARSVGRDNSVPAVAREMCVAAFRDYPNNLRGKVYEVKPGESEAK